MEELIERLAKVKSTTPAKAADDIDKVIHKVLKALRQGHSAKLHGLGEFLPGRQFRPENQDDPKPERKPVRGRR